MNKIIYYPSEKKYSTAGYSYPDPDNALELIRLANNCGINVQFNDIQSVKNPRFYICRGEGFLQLNRKNFFAVKIPDQVRPMLRYCSEIEVSIFGRNDSADTVYPRVEQVLRIPEYMLHDMTRHDQPRKPRDEVNAPSGYIHTHPAEIFYGWLAGTLDGEIVMEYRKEGEIFALVHDGNTMMLVSFFNEPESEWMATESENNDYPPLWFSAESYSRSPLYSVRCAAEYLRDRGLGRILPLVILSDHINIINARDMVDTWRESGVTVCYCSRKEEFIAPFAEGIEAAEFDHPEFLFLDYEEIQNVRKALHDFQDLRT
jgi:hypothetical protein